MNRHVHIRGISGKALANDETRLSMRVTAGAQPFDRRGQAKVSRHAGPREMEGIIGKPHVLPTASDHADLSGRIEYCGTALADAADVGVVLEVSKRCDLRLRAVE